MREDVFVSVGIRANLKVWRLRSPNLWNFYLKASLVIQSYDSQEDQFYDGASRYFANTS